MRYWQSENALITYNLDIKNTLICFSCANANAICFETVYIFDLSIISITSTCKVEENWFITKYKRIKKMWNLRSHINSSNRIAYHDYIKTTIKF